MRNPLSRILLPVVTLAVMALSAAAQLAPGQWSFPPAFEGGRTTHISPIADKVYYLSGINIFCYNPSTQETVALTPETVLNGVKATALHGDPAGKRLIVVYDDANLDIINPDGSVTNVTALRDARISGTRAVNDIAFIGSKAYIATDFGVVVLDCGTGHVIESGQYRGGADGHIKGGPLSLAVSDDRLLALFDDGYLYTSTPADTSHSYRETDKFTPVGRITGTADGKTWPATRIYTASPEVLIAETANSGGRRCIQRVNLPNASAPLTVTTVPGNYITATSDPWTDNSTLCIPLSTGIIAAVNANGTFRQLSAIPEGVKRYRAITSSRDGASAWFATPEGLHHYDLTQKPPLQLEGVHRPAARSVINVSRFERTSAGDGIIAYTRANSDGPISGSGAVSEPLQLEKRGAWTGYGLYTPGFFDLVTDGQATDITPMVADAMLPVSSVIPQATTRETRARYGDVVNAPLGVACNPLDPSQWWISTNVEGLFRVQNGIVDASFAGTGDNISWKPKPDNLPASGYYGQRVYDVKFDRSGNLWVLVSNANKPDKSGPQLVMLPAVKVSAPVSAISKADWVTARSNGSLLIPADFNCDVEGKLVMLPASNTIAVLGKYTADNLYLYRHSSNPADVNSSGGITLNTVYDQDGNAISLQFVTAAAEDPRGQLIVATLNGFFAIPHPDTFDPDKDRVRRFKVNNDDGTGTASYLLNGVNISAIEFDSAGRMWVSTEGSGISVINEDYNEIIEQFNTDNSPLPSNYVSALALDPLTNKVYTGGAWGLGVYASEQSPGHEDYDDVRVYPNPVRPEFSGQVTVDGLMNASLVKIVDAMGNLVYSGPSLGGTFRWNLRDIAGAPVRSGVYYICPSQSDDDSGPKGKVAAKLLVIR